MCRPPILDELEKLSSSSRWLPYLFHFLNEILCRMGPTVTINLDNRVRFFSLAQPSLANVEGGMDVVFRYLLALWVMRVSGEEFKVELVEPTNTWIVCLWYALTNWAANSQVFAMSGFWITRPCERRKSVYPCLSVTNAFSWSMMVVCFSFPIFFLFLLLRSRATSSGLKLAGREVRLLFSTEIRS